MVPPLITSLERDRHQRPPHRRHRLAPAEVSDAIMSEAKRERPERDPAHLHHMLDLAREAVQLVGDRPRAELVSNLMLSHGLAYCLTRIGRNADCVSAQGRAALPEINWTKLVDTGELLTTEYYNPHEQLVWQTITEDLPPLITALARALAEDDSAQQSAE